MRRDDAGAGGHAAEHAECMERRVVYGRLDEIARDFSNVGPMRCAPV